MILNAQLDDQSAYKIEFLKETTQDSLTDIIKKALDLDYDQLTINQQSPLEIMKKNGFIGCAPGPGDLSENYKEYLAKSLYSQTALQS
ncbi:CopG family transcriptional regulator [Deltaproteobacteria bacterium TL4]